MAAHALKYYITMVPEYHITYTVEIGSGAFLSVVVGELSGKKYNGK